MRPCCHILLHTCTSLISYLPWSDAPRFLIKISGELWVFIFTICAVEAVAAALLAQALGSLTVSHNIPLYPVKTSDNDLSSKRKVAWISWRSSVFKLVDHVSISQVVTRATLCIPPPLVVLGMHTSMSDWVHQVPPHCMSHIVLHCAVGCLSKPSEKCWSFPYVCEKPLHKHLQNTKSELIWVAICNEASWPKCIYTDSRFNTDWETTVFCKAKCWKGKKDG